MSAIPQAARIHDGIEHSSALAGLLLGLVAGALLGAFIMASGGLGAILIGAAVGGSLGATILEFAGSFITSRAGEIISGAATVFHNRRMAARAIIDTVDCHAGKHIAMGSDSVTIEGYPAARKEDKTECDGKICEGSEDVFIGRNQVQYLDIDPEVPLWLEIGVMALGLVGGVGAIMMAARGARLIQAFRMAGGLLGGLGGGAGAHWLGGRIFGEGSTGQRVLTFLGGFAGGWAGSRVARVPATRIMLNRAEAAGWQRPDGSPIYPPEGGYANPAPLRNNSTLPRDALFDRYGGYMKDGEFRDGGRYGSPAGTPYTDRALPPGTNNKDYSTYRVLKPLPVRSGRIAPWFGERGNGTQYEFDRGIDKLISDGYIERVSRVPGGGGS